MKRKPWIDGTRIPGRVQNPLEAGQPIERRLQEPGGVTQPISGFNFLTIRKFNSHSSHRFGDRQLASSLLTVINLCTYNN